MPYPSRIEVGAGGVVIETAPTDEWILVVKPKHYRLSADKTQIIADGVDFATITIQRVTPPLVDSSQPDVPGTGAVELLVGDEPAKTVLLDISGAATGKITVTELGAFKVRLSEVFAADNDLTLEGI